MNWHDIETAPKDGTLVNLRRVYNGRVAFEGEGLFGDLHPNAPSRLGLGTDPLGRLSAKDYRHEIVDRERWVSEPKWLKPDRMYAFPTPTHWAPVPAAQ